MTVIVMMVVMLRLMMRGTQDRAHLTHTAVCSSCGEGSSGRHDFVLCWLSARYSVQVSVRGSYAIVIDRLLSSGARFSVVPGSSYG